MQQKAKTKELSEAIKKYLEKLVEIHNRIKQLVEEKKHLIDEYQEKLKELESQIVMLYMEAGRILDILASEYGFSLSEIKDVLKVVPESFFKNALEVYKRKPDRNDINIAVERTYKRVVSEDDTIIRALKASQKLIQTHKHISEPLEKEKTSETFVCPLCQEEHDKETGLDVLRLCKQCKSFIETWLIGLKVFNDHGRKFVVEWKEWVNTQSKYEELRKKHSLLLQYLRKRDISIPKEFAS
ncbi:MAG: hypothetical protein QW599_05630 [Nitrososphaerota archaeon]